jgi:hypothetical protein
MGTGPLLTQSVLLPRCAGLLILLLTVDDFTICEV